jgi:hypothetical protein
MKHILNNLTDEEKNPIRGQHTGGMKVSTDNFSKLMKSKLGDNYEVYKSIEKAQQVRGIQAKMPFGLDIK